MRIRWLAMLIACAVPTAAHCAQKNSDPGAEAALARALQTENVWIDGALPMHLRGEIGIANGKGGMAQGTYTFDFVSPNKNREEIHFANYERVRVRGENGYWQVSSLNYQPEVVFQLDTLLGLRTMLTIGSKQVLSKLKNRRKDGIDEQCSEVKWTTGIERVLCFGKASGTLMEVDYPTGESQNPPEITRIEYSAFAAIGDKQMPREIRGWKDRKLVIQFKIADIERLEKTAQAADSRFQQPPNSEFWAGCADKLELVTRVHPVYPPKARANREGGRVVLYAVIEADGSLSHLTVIHHASPDLENAAIEAVRQWRYKVNGCGDSPGRMETSIPVDFWIQAN